ncbi:FAD-binding oxidoreductase [Mesobacterium pallidum]|uniref:FAD-binding oxidoreductase n=1 Tax=Mesobacterium pallidum TaxID=2872037 RepID=UPI001EE1C395|nr:FAD-binding oxidoreductase [Mesobacterium pallidum]
MIVEGWGRFPRTRTTLRHARGEDDARRAVAQSGLINPLIARGNGRAYGDSAASPGTTLAMRRMGRMIAFDATTGLLEAEAGVLLADVIAAFLPRGWFPAVTPGTKFVTLGGAIAADVHGKNHHHDGSFCDFVDWIDLMGPDGEVQRLGPNSPLFQWTRGGMGLTGVILRAAIRLIPVESAWIRQRVVATGSLAETMACFEESLDAPYSVAWIDCLATGAQRGRSLVMLGEHATRDMLGPEQRARPYEIPRKGTKTVPFSAPGVSLNRYSVGAFNALYYARGKAGAGTSLVDWDSYFYPLDAILHWNRIYGRKGLIQYQTVLPLDRSEAGLTAMLDAIAASGQGAFLSVLKRMGPQGGNISFPMEGYTLAMDFPRSANALALCDRLDKITLDHGGRYYLAKDSRLTPNTLRAADPRMGAFHDMRAREGLTPHLASAQSQRLQL